eukprot:snap_masked-scaffold_6-processed-gene-14.38-mRNA-1 protein AED:1.00 eAED:1.00 QI:0/-1/0/0/-1/1/1/0/169
MDKYLGNRLLNYNNKDTLEVGKFVHFTKEAAATADTLLQTFEFKERVIHPKTFLKGFVPNKPKFETVKLNLLSTSLKPGVCAKFAEQIERIRCDNFILTLGYLHIQPRNKLPGAIFAAKILSDSSSASNLKVLILSSSLTSKFTVLKILTYLEKSDLKFSLERLSLLNN